MGRAGGFVVAGLCLLVGGAGRCMPPGGGGPRLEGSDLLEREGHISNVEYIRLCCEIAWNFQRILNGGSVVCFWRFRRETCNVFGEALNLHTETKRGEESDEDCDVET